MGAANSTSSFANLLGDKNILGCLSLYCPSLPIRLRRVNKGFLKYFGDENLSQLLPDTFEKLGLYYSNPFIHSLEGDVESVWLMMVHGVDPRITGHVRS